MIAPILAELEVAAASYELMLPEEDDAELSVCPAFIVVGGESHEPYEGPYYAAPAFADQTLPTAGRAMTGDLVVGAIRVAYEDNAAGGQTVTIGEV